MKQVDSSHYNFQSYLHRGRWISVWHQLDEVFRCNPNNVLEIGSGSGLFKLISNHLGTHVETLDIDPDLKPDHIGNVTALPMLDNSYDVVCAFQVLEHLPYDEALRGFQEMNRVARSFVIISLPDVRPQWRYKIKIPLVPSFELVIQRPFFKSDEHRFDGQHYWEINKKGYLLADVIRDFSQLSSLVRTFRNIDEPYHRFLIFKSDHIDP